MGRGKVVEQVEYEALGGPAAATGAEVGVG